MKNCKDGGFFWHSGIFSRNFKKHTNSTLTLYSGQGGERQGEKRGERERNREREKERERAVQVIGELVCENDAGRTHIYEPLLFIFLVLVL